MLRQLRRVLEATPPRHFDIRFWGRAGRLPYGNGYRCGTAACAAGCAALDPFFRKLGLAIKPWPSSNPVLPACGLRALSRFEDFDTVFVPRIHGESAGMYELSVLFGLEEDEGCWLFDAERYEGRSSPREVIKRIDVLLAKYDARWYAEHTPSSATAVC
jgi:hypothetical protein